MLSAVDGEEGNIADRRVNDKWDCEFSVEWEIETCSEWNDEVECGWEINCEWVHLVIVVDQVIWGGEKWNISSPSTLITVTAWKYNNEQWIIAIEIVSRWTGVVNQSVDEIEFWSEISDEWIEERDLG